MITIFDTRVNLKDGLSGIPIRDIDWSTDLTLREGAQPRSMGVMHAVQMSSLVIIVDYNDRLYRVIKDRQTGKEWIGLTSELGEFLSSWVEEEQFTHNAAVAMDEDDNDDVHYQDHRLY